MTRQRALAVAGLCLVLAGCGSDPAPGDAACGEVRASADALATEITEFGEQIVAGTVTDDGTLLEKKRAWASLVLDDSDCFSAERVAVATTLLVPPDG